MKEIKELKQKNKDLDNERVAMIQENVVLAMRLKSYKTASTSERKRPKPESSEEM